MVWVRLPVYFYKRNETFYFSRAIPSDLQHRFKKRKIEVSLRTKSESKAAKSAAALSDRLERYWDSLRMEMIYSRELGLSVAPQAKRQASNDFSLTDALSLYHRLKGAGKTKLFFEVSGRSIRYLTECLGHDNLSMLKVSDGGQFRDFLFDRGMSSSSVKRVFSSVRAIVNLAIREQGIAVSNVFSGTYIPEDELKQKRPPIPMDALRQVQSSCRNLNDEPRWLIALISDTGMRLSEACGLLVSDIHLDTTTPYIDLVEHPWRRLKTEPSKRQIPLVGFSLWAAKQISHMGSDFAFPKYCRTNKCNANSASAALNKWLKPRVPEACVIHSFRHSIRDRLRAVECPTDIIDAIGGWSTEGVGQHYGVGFDLKLKSKWMKKLTYD
ncbi:tyrosine-type recombinase/integrase [Alphaproteobacteria bacterium]|nr:tyrosine-type recombinase/integrase [Alphaproteobacteria bacterium]